MQKPTDNTPGAAMAPVKTQKNAAQNDAPVDIFYPSRSISGAKPAKQPKPQPAAKPAKVPQKPKAEGQPKAAGSAAPRTLFRPNTNKKPVSGTPVQNTAPAQNAAPAQSGAQPVPAAVPGAKLQLPKNKKSGNRSRSGKGKRTQPLRIIPLGGLHEVGKNLTAIQYGDQMIIIDCGLMFPDNDMLGVDIVIPDFSFLMEHKKQIRAIFLTHGHEDHIGALPYLLKQLDLPVYGTRLTLGLVEGKLEEHRLNKNKLHTIAPGDTISLGDFKVEAIRVNHSIPDAVAFAVHTPAGILVHTGDWKIDYDPVEGEMIDLARFAELGKKGVLALMSDSTNSERPGVTTAEKRVGETYDMLFQKAAGQRLIIASFASNIHRVQQIIDKAKKYRRKVLVMGRSMENVTQRAMELGYLKVPKGLIIDLAQMNEYPPERIVLITTGSQGEPMAALSRMASGMHRQITVGKKDFIIISATPIPGNERHVSRVVNDLFKLGAEVIYENMYEVHTSGHARQDEQKTMLGLVRPQYFIPVHGEYRHLMIHAKMAQRMGVAEKNTVVAENGMVIELTDKSMKTDERVTAGKVMVDGLGVGDVGSIVLRDRKKLSEDGLITVVIAVDGATGEVVSGPDLVSRGFVYVKESEVLMKGAKDVVLNTLRRCGAVKDWAECKGQIRDALSQYLWQKTGRNPMILPIILDI